ncbi:hypothetical protein KZ483_21855 [Paenibacillus sp. sptzw28]|nr:hypothetical protein KZ483_21855 [Paenibacillus sp. sptzw28]
MFNVDLLVQADTNPLAMERLLHLLNQCGFADYRILSGVELGKLITELETGKSEESESTGLPPAVKNSEPQPAAAWPSVNDRIQLIISENRLIRLSVNKGYGVKLSIPCRIINYDENSLMLTVYHVDEKQVYSFSLNEIDDFFI